MQGSTSKIKPKLKINPALSRHCMGTIVVGNERKLVNGKGCLEAVRKIIKKHGITCLGEQLYYLPNNSFSLLAALSESHISIHTWPERLTVQLDVFLCNYMQDNTKKCEAIYNEVVDYFESVENDTTIVERL